MSAKIIDEGAQRGVQDRANRYQISLQMSMICTNKGSLSQMDFDC